MKEIPESLNLLRLILNGAITIYEADVVKITKMLHQQDRKDLFRALDTIAAALYLSKEEVENVLIPAAERE